MIRRVSLTGLLCLVLASCSEPASNAAIETRSPATRVVALAPHLAELVHAAGAGDRLVAVSEYSDYPDAVTELPTIGDAFAVDREALALTKPDVVFAWQSGTPKKTVEDLRRRGYRVEALRTESLSDVAHALRAIGEIAGTGTAARDAAQRFLDRIDGLRRDHAEREPIRVFYQISERPLYTVSGSHYISELIALCGGRNVFADLDELAPTVSAEAVLERDPEVLLTGRAASAEPAFEIWDRWPELAANRYANRFDIPADVVGRATPRLALAGAAMCARLDDARRNRDGWEPGE